MRVGRALTGGVALEEMLLQRHLIIDHLLSSAIESGRVGQVLEIASGMSGRGLRFTRRHGDLVYVEGDLPDMGARKRACLASARLTTDRHHVVALDVLADDGPLAVAEATRGLLDRSKGIAIVTEGLLSYLETSHVLSAWRRLARFASTFPADLYLSDVHMGSPTGEPAAVKVMRRMLAIFTRGRTHVHFARAAEAERAIFEQGYARAVVHRPRDWARALALPGTDGIETVQVLEASTRA